MTNGISHFSEELSEIRLGGGRETGSQSFLAKKAGEKESRGARGGDMGAEQAVLHFEHAVEHVE